MENFEKAGIPQAEFLRRAVYSAENGAAKEETRNIAKEAEAAGNLGEAVRITEECLHDYETIELRQKWSQKEENLGNFKKAADVVFVALGSKSVKGIAERAEAAQNYSDAHYIYYSLLHDMEKDREIVKKLVEQDLTTGKYLEAASLSYWIGATKEDVYKISEQAEAAGNLRDALLIYENVLEESSEKQKTLRQLVIEDEKRNK